MVRWLAVVVLIALAAPARADVPPPPPLALLSPHVHDDPRAVLVLASVGGVANGVTLAGGGEHRSFRRAAAWAAVPLVLGAGLAYADPSMSTIGLDLAVLGGPTAAIIGFNRDRRHDADSATLAPLVRVHDGEVALGIRGWF